MYISKAWRRWHSLWLDHCNANCQLLIAERHRNIVLQRRCLCAMCSYVEARREAHHNFGQCFTFTSPFGLFHELTDRIFCSLLVDGIDELSLKRKFRN